MTRRRASPEGLYFARRVAHRNRLEVTGMSREVVDQWLTAWEAEARQRGLDPRASDFWAMPRAGSPSSGEGGRSSTMPNDFGWVAIATFVLGAATVWLGWQTRQARVEARESDVKRILRAALAEQLDNCRAWASHDPARGQPSFEWLRTATPRLDALQSMIQQLDLPADVVPYLVWLIGTIAEEWVQLDKTLNSGVGPTDTLTVNVERLPDEWRVMVERLQVAAAFIAGEARRRGFDDLAAPYSASPWVVPLDWGERSREMTWMNDIAWRGAPSFPADPRFAWITPVARDGAGARTVERQKAYVLNGSDRVRRILRRR